MSSELATACNVFAERLVQLVDQDQVLREFLNALALKLVLATEKRESSSVNGQSHEQHTEMAPNVTEGEKMIECLPTLTLGRTAPVITEGLAENVRKRPRLLWALLCLFA